jgi:predicted O-methyltransferase YrrM
MNTLIQAPVSTVLSTLFAEANAADAELDRLASSFSEAQRAAIMSDPEAAKAFYLRAKNYFLAVSPNTGTLLYSLVRSMRAKCIVEFGTSFGISTIHMAAGLRDNGGGILITTEFEPGKVAKAQSNIESAGLSDLVEVRAGDALQTLSRDLPEAIDLVLLDGAKGLYPDVLAILEPSLHAGALIVADNADWCPEYLQRVRSGARYISVPFAGDVELSCYVG